MAQYTKGVMDQFGGASQGGGWSWRLIFFAGLVLFIVVLIYLGMRFGYAPYLQAQKTGLEEEIAELQKQISKEKEDELVSFYAQLMNVRTLLSGHVKGSAAFDILEKRTSPNVFYSKARIAVAAREIELEGVVRTHSDLVKQLEAFRSYASGADQVIERVQLSDSQIGDDGKIGFRMRITLAPGILKSATPFKQ